MRINQGWGLIKHLRKKENEGKDLIFPLDNIPFFSYL